MIEFLLAAIAMVLLALGLLLRPFLRKTPLAISTSHRQLNTAVYRDQLAKLKRDYTENQISVDDYAQAQVELQRRLLEDTVDDDAAISTHAPKWTIIGIAVGLPLVAAALYFALGNPAALRPPAVQAAVSQPDVERMVDGLAARLAKQPDDLKGWAMLARSYKVLGRTVDAEKAFDQAGAYLNHDAQLLAEYADVAATNAQGNFSGKPARLVQQALQIDPNNTMALWLAGSAAFNARDYAQALVVWQRLAKQLPPGSDDARMLQSAIDDAQAKASPVPAKAVQNSAASGVSGVVELDPGLKVSPTDTVMVIARAVGERMPVAVLRAPAARLPLPFTLDDSTTMSPEAHISTLGSVNIEARISKTGMAMPESGDLISKVATVKLGVRGLHLKVDSTRR